MSELSVGQLKGLTVNDNTITVPSGHKLYAPGSIVQVQHVSSSGTRYAIATQDLSAIPELQISFTPKFNNSKLLIQAMINGSSNHVTTYGFLKNGGNFIGAGNTNVGGGSVSTVYDGRDSAGYMHNQYIAVQDTVTSLSTIVYQAAVSASWSGTIRTTYINDRDSNDMRSISSMTIWEIAQ
jgi:hypothetical protein